MATASGHTPLPGFESPAVGFDSPFEMLEACHERVQRTLNLLVRLESHVQLHGCDDQARQAAQDVMRYFDLAAPLHHEDEELHVFPAVLARGDGALASAVKQLIAQHRQMEVAWATLRDALSELVCTGSSQKTPPVALRADAIAAFVSMYEGHIRLEEDVVYPAANSLLDLVEKQGMGVDMKTRRGA
jgi:hemerythrin-like domain-containing protein